VTAQKNKNKILRWRAFEGTQQLVPYFAHIRLMPAESSYLKPAEPAGV
jgi:hypothetical protein